MIHTRCMLWRHPTLILIPERMNQSEPELGNAQFAWSKYILFMTSLLEMAIISSNGVMKPVVPGGAVLPNQSLQAKKR